MHHCSVPAWIDTHCHLDAPEFAPDRAAVRARARSAGVRLCVIPAVAANDFEAVRALADELEDARCAAATAVGSIAMMGCGVW